jgi:hypothetical protein
MSRRLGAVVVVVVLLALGAGVAFATTQTTSGGTNVCVNNANGVVRVAESCRDGEHPLTIGGGGGNAQATQNGTFTVPWGETGTGKTLPLTGAIISGRCDIIPPEFGEGGLPRLLIEAATGTTMDVFADQSAGGTGKTSVLLPPAGGSSPGGVVSAGTRYAILTSNGATAAITVGGTADRDSRTCIFLWEAVETSN